LARIIDENNDLYENYVYQLFTESEMNSCNENDKIKININCPTTNPEPFNEYEHDGSCSLLFPKLFPTGFGDPTKNRVCLQLRKLLVSSIY
jgi:hypothetical protein